MTATENRKFLRRPLCAGLLLFLALWLPAALWAGRWRKTEGEGRAPLRETSSQPAPCAGSQLLLEGTAAGLFEPADGSQENCSFALSEITSFSVDFIPTQEDRVLCYLKEGEALPKTGSRVRVRGECGAFRAASNPGEFDAAGYYGGQGFVCPLWDVAVEAQGEGFSRPGQFLYRLRRNTARLYWRVLGDEDGALAAAMALGGKKEMDEEIKTLYQNASISHLLAISGLHITMIGMGLFSLLRRIRIPLWLAALSSAAFLCAYGVMTGMSVSTRRAVIMFVFLLAGRLLGRTADSLTSLAAAAAAILIPSPASVFDPGFQLSFAAAASAVLLAPALADEGIRSAAPQEGRRAFLKRALNNLRKNLMSSFGITLGTLPLLLWHFYKWNPWSVLANLAVIPLMGILLPLLLALALAGLPAPWFPQMIPVLKVLFWPVRLIFLLYRQICTLAVWLPGSSVHVGEPKLWQIALFSLGLALLLWKGRKVRPSLRLGMAALLTGVFLIRLPGPLTIAMLDVGQGQSVCVETKHHSFWLLDAGSTSKSRTGQYQIVPYLKYRGVRRLEGILVSHWDEDHISGLEDIFRWAKQDHVPIGGLYLPQTLLEDAALETLLALAGEYEIPVARLRSGMALTRDGITLSCLHPFGEEGTQDRNEVSMVIRLTQGEFAALFPGDLPQEGEKRLAELCGEAGLSADLLAAGHHGAKNASCAAFLEAVSPRAALISCGVDNPYGHPARETLERFEAKGIPCFVTAQRGAVTVSVRQGKMEIRCFS